MPILRASVAASKATHTALKSRRLWSTLPVRPNTIAIGHLTRSLLSSSNDMPLNITVDICLTEHHMHYIVVPWVPYFSSKGAPLFVPEGKGEAGASPSPLSRWGQFPIFTGVRVAHRATPNSVAPTHRGVTLCAMPC